MESGWVEAVAYIAGIVVLACCSYFLQLATKPPKECGLIVDQGVTLPPSTTLPRSWVPGSGIPEVKLVLWGWVIPGFLNFRIIIAKSVALVFSTASGLRVGKEGPYVHIAICIGAVICQLGERFGMIDAETGRKGRRNTLRSSAACGFAAAFGVPFTGTTFALEEFGYEFHREVSNGRSQLTIFGL